MEKSITLQCVHQPNVITNMWQNTKVVTATSTNAQLFLTMKTVEKMKYSCPQNILYYIQYIGSVDRNSQMQQYYHKKLTC